MRRLVKTMKNHYSKYNKKRSESESNGRSIVLQTMPSTSIRYLIYCTGCCNRSNSLRFWRPNRRQACNPHFNSGRIYGIEPYSVPPQGTILPMNYKRHVALYIFFGSNEGPSPSKGDALPTELKMPVVMTRFERVLSGLQPDDYASHPHYHFIAGTGNFEIPTLTLTGCRSAAELRSNLLRIVWDSNP